MIQKLIATVLRSILAYLVLLALGRLMGRKMISRITVFDFLIGVTLGSLAVRIALGDENSLLTTVISAVVITCMALITDRLNIKSSLFRKIEEGEPVLLIRNGKLLDENFAKAKISISKLLMLLRQKDVFEIEDVNYAIFENDGNLTVLLKPEKLPVSAGDLKIAKPANRLSADVIVDGKIIPENLKASGHTEGWLLRQLQSRGIGGPEQVFYASVNAAGRLFAAPYGKSK